LYLIVFGSALGFSAYIYILRHSTPSRVATYAFVNPVIALRYE
jgi:drug/metabolite transporter (DMT)-like permease